MSIWVKELLKYIHPMQPVFGSFLSTFLYMELNRRLMLVKVARKKSGGLNSTVAVPCVSVTVITPASPVS
ncbi:uncharacterized protein Smp_202800 [Schistosoma mansoni]|uniref:uncharacterized protein n=1 Tax=Schistosoma mansoni TaxID=6183 RepID=UPI00022DC78E|nr:uncharacterized protein Smp_202800 [Schistosoma mansoni]|eukprot:XP_018652670.1 uncharacterized protein Smp_202800 [Schistosoma mansoni]